MGVQSVAWSPDGGSWPAAPMTTRCGCGTRRRAACASRLEGHTEVGPACGVVAGRQRLLASGSGDNTVRLWERQRAARARSRATPVWSTSVAWSPDGAALASGSYDNTVRLWERDGPRALALEGHTKGVRSVAWSPDGSGGQRLRGQHGAAVGAATGREARLGGHDDWVTACGVVAGRRPVASGSDDNTVRLWDVATCRPPASSRATLLGSSGWRGRRRAAAGHGLR